MSVQLNFVDRGSIVPLYYQIQQQLLESIRRGDLKAGDPIPSEQEIAKKLGVSRMTVRLAIKSLCKLGIIYSQQGKGSFVSGLKLEKNFRQVLSFTEEMRLSGRQPRSRLLAFKRMPAGEDIRNALNLNKGEQVFKLTRLRIADAVPMGIESSYLPTRLCPDLKQTFDPCDSLYQMLSQRYGVQITIADEVVEAALAGPEEARLLCIPRKSAVFLFTRTSYSAQCQPVEYVKSTYRADRYKIVNRLTRFDHDLFDRKAKNA